MISYRARVGTRALLLTGNLTHRYTVHEGAVPGFQLDMVAATDTDCIAGDASCDAMVSFQVEGGWQNEGYRGDFGVGSGAETGWPDSPGSAALQDDPYESRLLQVGTSVPIVVVDDGTPLDFELERELGVSIYAIDQDEQALCEVTFRITDRNDPPVCVSHLSFPTPARKTPSPRAHIAPWEPPDHTPFAPQIPMQ